MAGVWWGGASADTAEAPPLPKPTLTNKELFDQTPIVMVILVRLTNETRKKQILQNK